MSVATLHQTLTHVSETAIAVNLNGATDNSTPVQNFLDIKRRQHQPDWLTEREAAVISICLVLQTFNMEPATPEVKANMERPL